MISKIAKYRIDSELGRGGFGRVYQAYDPDVQRPVAIKVLTAESDPELLKRFQAEIGTTGRLRHKNIVTLFECGEQSGVPFLVMELLEGQSLERVIKDSVPLTLLQKVRLMTQVAEGLAYAHAQGVIHRDVKPANIMLLPDESIKIMDFGIARVADRATHVTREGYIVGTIPYMAPEQFEAGGRADELTDIFAYGDVYYELLTGRHPFSVEEMYGTIGRIKTFEPEAVSRLVPECPEALELIVHRALSKDREFRYQTFNELLLDSEALLLDLQHQRAAELLLEVRPLMQAGELDQAEAKLHHVLELDPGNRDARQLRTQITNEIRQRGIIKRVAALLAESDDLLRRRQFAAAVDTLENALRLKKTDTAIQRRLDDAKTKLSGYLRANKLLAEARRDHQKGQLEPAIQRLHEALAVDPDNPDANTLATRLRTEWARRTAENHIETAIGTAHRLLAQGEYDQAWETVKNVDSERVADLRARIEREKLEAERRKRAEQLDVAMSRIREALEAGELVKAEHVLQFVKTHFAGEQGLSAIVAQVRAQLDAALRIQEIAGYVARARDLARQNSLAQALDVLNEGVQRFPDDTGLVRMRDVAEARRAKQERDEALAAAVAMAANLRDSGKLAEALEVVKDAMRHLGEDTRLIDLSRELEAALDRQRYLERLAQVLRHTRRLETDEKFEEAIRVLEASSEFAEEPEIQALLAALRAGVAEREERRVVQTALETARGLEGRGSLDAALKSLDPALSRYPQNTALTEAADALKSSIAEAQRRARIDFHGKKIAAAIAAAEWTTAEAAISRAQRECPGESAFDGYAEEVRRALFDLGLSEVTAKVRASLAANETETAVRQLSDTRALYLDEPRWEQLEQEVFRRKAYDEVLAGADRERRSGNVAGAEERLTRALLEGAPDDRAARMLEMIRAERAAEQARIERERAERERAEAERREQERQAKERAEQERLAAEQRERERQGAQRREQERLARERAEEERVATEQREKERLAKQRAEEERAERERVEAERREQERLAKQRAEAERAAAEQREKERLAAEGREQERLAKQRAEQERAERERVDAERREQERQAKERAGKERLAAEQREKERLDAERREQERLANERAERERREQARLAQERTEQERLVSEQREKDRVAAERRQQERLAKERAERERRETEQREQERLAIERRQDEREGPQTAEPLVLPPPHRAPKKAVQTTLIVSGIAAVIAIMAAILFLPSLFHKPAPPKPPPNALVQFEIRTDPPGAAVKLGDRSCHTPNCTFDLAPGDYRMEARLQGYVPVTRNVTVHAGDRPLDVTLQPVPVELPKPGAATGTLIVKTGIADAEIIVDKAPRGRTDSSGEFTLPLEVKSHEVAVDKAGYVATPREQTVRVSENGSHTVRFRLEPQNAMLEIRGAPAGADLSVDGVPIGKTNGALFTAPVKPGDKVLQVSLGAATRKTPQRFDPGQRVALDWTSVAPPLSTTQPKPEPKPTTADLEAKAWDAVRNSSTPADFEKFVNEYPNGAHKEQAQAKWDDLVWSRTNQNDAQSLQTYRDRFPRGAHVRDAAAKLDDLAYNAVNKKDPKALRAFLDQHPGTPHKTDAQNILDQLDKDRLAEQQQVQQERARQEQLQQQLAAQSKAIQSAIDRFNAAFQGKRVREVKEIWPTVPSRYTDAMGVPGSTFVLMLRPTGEPKLNGDTASVPCELVQITTARGQTMSSPPKAVTVALQKAADRWIVLDPLR